MPACGLVPGAPFLMPGAAAVVRDSSPELEEAPGRFSFPRSRRLVHSHQFQNVYRHRKAKRAHGRIVSCVWVPNGQPAARLGLAVSKRALRRNSARNTFKRLVREHFRLHPLSGMDLIVSCRRDVRPPLDRRAIRLELADLWDRIKP